MIVNDTNIIGIIGAICLGIIIIWIVMYFVRRFESFTPAALGSVVSIILGGVVINFLETDKSILWFYPMGLVIGFVSYRFVAYLRSD